MTVTTRGACWESLSDCRSLLITAEHTTWQQGSRPSSEAPGVDATGALLIIQSIIGEQSHVLNLDYCTSYFSARCVWRGLPRRHRP